RAARRARALPRRARSDVIEFARDPCGDRGRLTDIARWNARSSGDPPAGAERRVRSVAGDRFGERFGRGLGAPAGEMLDLLAARNTGRDDERVGMRRLHRGSQPAVAEGNGDVVVLTFEAEGPGHAAAAGIDFADVIAGPLQRSR